MKKINLLFSLTLLSSLSSLTSCNKTMSATYYGMDQGKKFVMVSKIDTTVSKGVMTSNSIEETYTPIVWAELSTSDKDKIDTTNYLTYTSGSTSKYYAKYIKIGTKVWEGKLRDANGDYQNDGKFIDIGEYVRYSLLGASDDNSDSDLMRYLATRASNNSKDYYEAVVNDNIQILKKDGDNYVDSTIKPSFPDDKFISTNSKYTDYYKALTSITTFFNGRKINYRQTIPMGESNKTSFKFTDGVLYYNDSLTAYVGNDEKLEEIYNSDDLWMEIEGATGRLLNNNSVNNVLDSINRNFASVEYQTVK